VSVAAATRYRLDDLRRLAASTLGALAVSPPRASAMASHLLWFDAAGAPSHGIASLPTWLDRLDRKEVDPVAEGRTLLEHSGTAVFDARNGLAPLILTRAGGIAAEKARDVGVGIVRVVNLGPAGPPAPVAADLAVGPFVATIVGPGGSFAAAVPMPEGLPAVYDPALGSAEPPGWLAVLSPWSAAMAGADGWAIIALAVAAMDPLTTFHERAATSFAGAVEGEGRLLPSPWEGRRRQARERGVALDETASAGLRNWSDRLGVPWPPPVGG